MVDSWGLMWDTLAARNNYHDWGWLVYTTHKHPAGSGMERVGVSNSLLGTYDQHWDLPMILPLTMMQNV